MLRPVPLRPLNDLLRGRLNGMLPGPRIAALMLLLLVVMASLMSGCAGNPPGGRGAERRVPFDAGEYERYNSKGNGTISGQVVVATPDGTPIYGTGQHVWLNPVTRYSREWWERTIVHAEKLEPGDSRAERLHRETRADGQGHFWFEKLPPGHYYLASSMRLRKHGGHVATVVLGGKVDLGPGERAEVSLREIRARDSESAGWRIYGSGGP